MGHRFEHLINVFSEKYNMKCGDNILIHECGRTKILEEIVYGVIPRYARNENAKLLVLDTITPLFGFEKDYIQRAAKISSTCQLLAKVVSVFGLYVIFVNETHHVNKSKDIEYKSNQLGIVESGNKLIKSALSLSLSNNIHTRIMLTTHISTSRTTRMFHLVYSPHHPRLQMPFEVTNDGVKFIDNSKVNAIKGKVRDKNDVEMKEETHSNSDSSVNASRIDKTKGCTLI